MRPAVEARGHLAPRQLAVVEASAGAVTLSTVRSLPSWLEPGDAIVLNDAATLPSSLFVTGSRTEVRLLQRRGDGWDAVLLGEGDWRLRTEDRPAPPPPALGQRLAFEGGLTARVTGLFADHPRRVLLQFDQTGEAFWRALYRGGRPVQYSYLTAPLALWDVQTGYADRPRAMEAPSAGFALSWELLFALRDRGVHWARLTHGCGLSSTGEVALDAALPVPEGYEIPEETAELVTRVRARGRRVIAIGTSVVRALETWAAADFARAALNGTTSLRIEPRHRLRAVDGILSGMHSVGESHHALLQAFAPLPLLERTHRLAESAGFLAHEFGDATLILR